MSTHAQSEELPSISRRESDRIEALAVRYNITNEEAFTVAVRLFRDQLVRWEVLTPLPPISTGTNVSKEQEK